MRNYPIHVTWAQGKIPNTLCITWGSKLSFMTLKSDEKFEENWLVVWKWHEEFGKISKEHSKMSKLGLWWNPFVQNSKYISLKFTEESCVMAMKNDTKIEERLTCRSKIDMRNFTNFDPSTQKSKKFCFNGLLVTKIFNVSVKKVRRSYLS